MKLLFFIIPLFYIINVFAACEFNQQYERVALVIGNKDYDYIKSLENPINDAKNIAEVLRHYDFSVIERHNLTKVEMQNAINCFANTLIEDGVGLMFYAGHGAQAGQNNYLIPSDFDVDPNETNVENLYRDHAIGIDIIMGVFNSIKTNTNIIILDACRDNPYKSKTRSLKISKLQRELTNIAKNGLAKMTAPVGSYIAFATSPGETSLDGDGKNGLFTGKLLRYIKDPNLDINSVFDKTSADVYNGSNKLQIPWRTSSLLKKFYFSPLGGSSSGSSAINLNTPISSSFEKYFNKGKQLLHEKSRPKKALLMFKKALKHSQENSDLFYEMAIANSSLYKHGQAINFLKKVIAINPEHPSAYSLLSHSYLKLGDGENAKHFRIINQKQKKYEEF